MLLHIQPVLPKRHLAPRHRYVLATLTRPTLDTIVLVLVLDTLNLPLALRSTPITLPLYSLSLPLGAVGTYFLTILLLEVTPIPSKALLGPMQRTDRQGVSARHTSTKIITKLA